MQNLILKENVSDNYKVRTEENVRDSDLTLAIAIDFDSFGEKITKELCLKHNKKYIAVYPDGDILDKAQKIVEKINNLDLPQKFVLNIAGNGLSTMKGKMLQNEADDFTYALLKALSQNPKLNSKIGSVRTGGQSGFDEAGAKAALKLGFMTIVHMPRGFKMRNQDGKDITMSYEHAKLRFDVIKSKVVYVDMDDTICDYSTLWNLYKEKYPDVQFPQSKFGFFSRLKPVDGALDALFLLERHYNIFILTKPSIKNLHSYSEKAEWVEKYLGEKYLEKLILCPDKSLVKGHYLIDDYDKNGQTEFEGEFIRFKSELFPDWSSVVKYLLKNTN